jgi:cytochrome c oxidase assembly factor 5
MYAGAALAQCLSESPCILAGHSAAECLREPLVSQLPTQCQQLKKGYGDCKRGMIDMRKRFRGNKPIAATPGANDSGDSRYIGGVGDGMLYAGIGRKDLGLGKVGEVGYGAGEDERMAAEEMVPGRFREESGGAGAYYSGYTPPPESTAKIEGDVDKRGKTEREGAGWNWWRGS